MNEMLLEPVRFYENTGKQRHEDHAKEAFEELLKRSGVNEEENRLTVKLYDEALARVDEVEKQIRKYKTAKTLLIILSVVGGIMLLFSLLCLLAADVVTGIILLLLGLAALIIPIVVIKKKIKPLLDSTARLLEQRQAEANELLDQARAQVAPLLALFTEDDTVRLIEKTVPDLEFDPRFTRSNEAFFINHHDFCDLATADTSILNTLSGRLAGNPFLFCRSTVCEMGTQTYHGTLTISWTETYRDSKGNRRTRRRTQVLHASVVKPKPFYHFNNHLCFGSQAAPDLSFSRDPQDTEELTEKQIEKKVKKGAKQLKKMTNEALSEGHSFQEMANTEFEVLFGALNRDHEVQFRLLFTPLAQRNMVELVSDKDAYGDDFRFDKRRRFNIITSEHTQGWDLSTAPQNYYSHAVAEIREKFVSFNNEFFKKLFFDFAPLMSIPAYVEEPCAALDDIEDYDCNYTYYEHEVMANRIGQRKFAHERSATQAILKAGLAKKKGGGDLVSITAYSYAAENRVDFVPVMGGDGRLHSVPVHWVEYIPIEKTTDMTVSPAASDDAKKETTGTFFHGMVARALE